jgi:two-component system LytT family response regulator
VSGDPLRVIIVDDETPAREGLRIRLERERDVVVVGEYSQAAAALDAIRAEPPDLVFLDIEMPEMDGFSMLARRGDLLFPAVVFVTAHEEHAVRAFRVPALDYLLKPVDQDRLHSALERAREHRATRSDAELASRVRGIVRETDSGARPPVSDPGSKGAVRIPLRQDGSIYFVSSNDIDWIDAAGDYVRLHVGKVTHMARKSMGEMLALLDPSQFLRIHRSTIVNIDRVKELQPYFHGEYIVVLHNGTKLKLSRGQRDKLAEQLGLRSG